MTSEAVTAFDDIRPYNDDEVDATLVRVLESDELIKAIARLRFPKLVDYLGWILCPLVRYKLTAKARQIHSIRQLQEVVGELMNGMIARCVTELSVSGLDRLDPSEAYLFISNHRDIAMDPAFVNWVLHSNGMDTVRIAIGDNLLTKPYVSDLIRLNKSFIVKRSATSRREKFQASKHLSAYVFHSITSDHSHVWIAQREGRAKDGRDVTNSALISMLALSRSKSESFASHVQALNIVPVAISYEWDPCDRDKARELYQLQKEGAYAKGEHEDVASIAKGIDGFKGRVHLSFGTVMRGNYETADEVAAEINQQIWESYVLHPSNHVAYQMLTGEKADLPDGVGPAEVSESARTAATQELERRLDGLSGAQRELLLKMYANPLISKVEALPPY